MEEIKKLLGTKNLIIGKDETMKAIRAGELKKVFLASNVDSSLKEDIEYYNKIKEFEVVLLKMNNEDLGIMCKKPFSIQVLGVK